MFFEWLLMFTHYSHSAFYTTAHFPPSEWWHFSPWPPRAPPPTPAWRRRCTLSGPGFCWTTPRWRQRWSYSVSIRPIVPQVSWDEPSARGSKCAIHLRSASGPLPPRGWAGIWWSHASPVRAIVPAAGPFAPLRRPLVTSERPQWEQWHRFCGGLNHCAVSALEYNGHFCLLECWY